MYGCNLFIDKSYALNHWSSSLLSSYSSLSHVDRMKMIHYATHDVMAFTFLIRSITEKWTFDKIESRKMNEIFVAFNSTKLSPCNDPDAEEISSDDEIYLNQLIEPNDFKNEQDNNNNNNDDENSLLPDQSEPIDVDYIPVINDDEPTERSQQEPESVNNNLLNDNELIVNDHYMVDDVNDKEEPASTEQRTKNQQRSVQARHRKNQRRNKALRRKRYYYSIKRK
ncbi:unnamed protein product [Rotaria sordida]|nr:unnamed protein product [Rotaria sordida]CAF1538620.1 unnamed protein product [Rotaria sordida]